MNMASGPRWGEWTIYLALNGMQQSWDHKHGRDHPVADCFPVLVVPIATEKEAGAVPQHGSCSTYLFPVYADAGQAVTCTLWALRKARTGRAGPGFRYTGSAASGCVHRVLYSPQSDTC